MLTSSYDAMLDTIKLIRMSGERELLAAPSVIGGNQLNGQVCQYVGADYRVNDAMSGVRLRQKIMGAKA